MNAECGSEIWTLLTQFSIGNASGIYSAVHSSHKLLPLVTTHMSEHEVCLSKPVMLLEFGWELYQ